MVEDDVPRIAMVDIDVEGPKDKGATNETVGTQRVQ